MNTVYFYRASRRNGVVHVEKAIARVTQFHWTKLRPAKVTPPYIGQARNRMLARGFHQRRNDALRAIGIAP